MFFCLLELTFQGPFKIFRNLKPLWDRRYQVSRCATNLQHNCSNSLVDIFQLIIKSYQSIPKLNSKPLFLLILCTELVVLLIMRTCWLLILNDLKLSSMNLNVTDIILNLSSWNERLSNSFIHSLQFLFFYDNTYEIVLHITIFMFPQLL